MDIGAIFQILASADKQAQASNPYSGFESVGDSLGNLVTQAAGTGNYGYGEAIAAGLASGLIGGTAKGLGSNYRAEQNALAQQSIRDIFKGGDIFQPEGMHRDVWGAIQGPANLFKQSRDWDVADRGATADLQLRNQLTTQAAQRPRDPMNQAILEKMGIPVQGASRPLVEPRPEASDGLFPGGAESMNSKFKKVVDEYQQAGATPNAAIEAAQTMTAAERKAMMGSVDAVAEARASANALDSIISTAEAGIEGAGVTGGFGWGGRNLLSSLYATVNSEEAQQRASQQLLDSVRPDLIKAVRSKGAGAMSDPEMREYLGAGPGSTNPKESNLLLVEKLKNVRDLTRSYADFLDVYREEKGTTQGAERLWQQYKAANPMFVRDDQSNSLVFNTNRPSWQEFFGGGVAQPQPMVERRPPPPNPGETKEQYIQRVMGGG